MPRELVGVHHNILLESVSKRLVDAIAGRGGIENVVQFLDQLDWIPEEARVLRSKGMSLAIIEKTLERATKRVKENLEKNVGKTRAERMLAYVEQRNAQSV